MTNRYMIYDPVVFERCTVERVKQAALAKGLNFKQHAELAHLSDSPDVTWRAIRNQGQRLSLVHFVQLLNTLDIDPATVLFEVQEIQKKERGMTKTADEKFQSGAKKNLPEILKKAANHD